MCAKENKDINVTLILEKVKDYFGFVPKIFQVLSENPVALKVFFDKAEFMMADDSLPPLTKEFVSIGAAAAMGSPHCLATHLEVAKELGASNEELLLAIIIGASITESTALSKSLRVYDDFKK
ncbi:MAG: carboxymuconolactone decarboxylase family protein [Euryarchaeota archaeon]|jgi:AhpD family alkylhydroperoxidase|uniref:carboxymuconolactone decarboxylase family protein n=1 Tax=Methanobacterium sp. MZD130B TaxID=3394378 RepID=UPI0009CAF340|nr:carboxymuconolactone decarboxylase family protein [Euryarchaeota archaeon]OPZ94193.1 MAG: Carboxymuconolactone decarboxylase family protein [Firmicutes bacterium ADurb.Bin419]HHT18265.1 carboxymuconolactone decarboxylase family protein [Methanobacterium sp.]